MNTGRATGGENDDALLRRLLRIEKQRSGQPLTKATSQESLRRSASSALMPHPCFPANGAVQSSKLPSRSSSNPTTAEANTIARHATAVPNFTRSWRAQNAKSAVTAQAAHHLVALTNILQKWFINPTGFGHQTTSTLEGGLTNCSKVLTRPVDKQLYFQTLEALPKTHP